MNIIIQWIAHITRYNGAIAINVLLIFIASLPFLCLPFLFIVTRGRLVCSQCSHSSNTVSFYFYLCHQNPWKIRRLKKWWRKREPGSHPRRRLLALWRHRQKPSLKVSCNPAATCYHGSLNNHDSFGIRSICCQNRDLSPCPHFIIFIYCFKVFMGHP